MAPVKGSKPEGKLKKNKTKSVKQRIRSVKRLLSKPDLPANVRVAQERMLDLFETTLKEGQQTKKDGKMIKKYRMVKFFEKRKLWRQHRSTTKELQDTQDSDRIKELEELQMKITKDLNYIVYYPSNRKYISLFPAQPYLNASIINEQEELYSHINEKVDAGELPQATFDKNFNEKNLKSKRKDNITRLHVHMDKRKDAKKNSVQKDLAPSLDNDDFFIDKSGDQMDVD